jgi:hypothetical protein
VARLDLGRVGDAGQVEVAAGLAERCAKLVEPGELAGAEVDAQRAGGCAQAAHDEKLPKLA